MILNEIYQQSDHPEVPAAGDGEASAGFLVRRKAVSSRLKY